MRDDKVTERLEMRWFPVVDARGRTHMEARWIVASESSTPVAKPHAAA